MHGDAERTGPQITIGADSRVTRSGHFLRKYKLDELPQFINVLLGDMSIVGPRPEVPRYVDLYPDALRELVFSVRPGITDLASIEFKDESALLGRASDPERTYVDEIMPKKLQYCVEYVSNYSLISDAVIIWKTIRAVFRKR
jgi:lipopolysaccharide/colanic/teichoic acid biosynthesis glycosyltransferase